MLDDISTFLREMPVKYYLGGGLWSTKEPTLAFFIGQEKIEALVAGSRGGVGYEGSLEKDNDAPPLAGGQSSLANGTGSRTLSRKLTSRYRLRRNVRHLFVVDAEKKDRFFGVNTLERLRQRSISAALEEMHENPQQIFGSWPEQTPFRWAILNREISLGTDASPRIDEPILIFGIADEICASFESWAETQGASITAILPLSIAVLAWCNANLATKDRDSLVVVATGQGAVSAAFKRRSLIYISQEESVADAFSALEREVDALELEWPARYLWALNNTEERRTIPEELVIIDEENIEGISGESLALQEGHGKKIKHDRPIAHLLNWLVKQ
jgi:CBS domain-containing protein